MSKFLIAVLLLSLLNDGNHVVTAWEDQDFFKSCPPSKCSKDGPVIRFPLRLESKDASCGAPGMYLSCSGEDTIMSHPIMGSCKVTAINYKHGTMKVIPLVESLSHCPIQKIISTSLSTDYRNTSVGSLSNSEDKTPYVDEHASLLCCSREFTPSAEAYNFVGPISCLSDVCSLSYLVAAQISVYVLPLDCKVAAHRIRIPRAYNKDDEYYEDLTFNERATRIINFSETTLAWSVRDITDVCIQCEQEGRHCGFSSQRRLVFCQRHGSRVKIIAVTSSMAIFLVILLVVATVFYRSLKSKYDEEVHLKVEMFLKTYGTLKPTRYTFSDIKQIARRFKDKVGQGGFGSVYRGELPNGVPVAVKMLEDLNGEGDEFISEIATIGRIHHANVVRLLGFCSEGTRRALIYEFMPNGSLENYIFACDSSSSHEFLVPDKMLDIALGIARGIEYLHQGCSQRILHFDIKPHNILLDYSFNPKISDFGLAKMYARDKSIVTLTAARGTIGYIAPELYSRNFGAISCKSDIYSFGMLVLEMVSGRRNLDPMIENQNEVYFPEWIYEIIFNGRDLVLTREMGQEGKEMVRQLAIVALWCIQWNPNNRPTMSKVVNMLEGRLQDLQMPPKPFV
ncbi:rust resistance kinase Lr10 [Aegilops tauschii subsp. strangulata]|nr:rust resistance kinase Lr10 [Aegilops tauschii subsp. strangulata]